MNRAQAIERLNQANNITDGEEQLQALRKLGRSLKIDLRGIRIYRDSFTPTLVQVWDTRRSGGTTWTCHPAGGEALSACEAKAEYISLVIARHLRAELGAAFLRYFTHPSAGLALCDAPAWPDCTGYTSEEVSACVSDVLTVLDWPEHRIQAYLSKFGTLEDKLEEPWQSATFDTQEVK